MRWMLILGASFAASMTLTAGHCVAAPQTVEFVVTLAGVGVENDQTAEHRTIVVESLPAALEQWRSLPPETPAIISLLPGRYDQVAGWKLTSADSGTVDAPRKICVRGPGYAVLDAGRRIPPEQLRTPDAASLERIPAVARSAVRMVELGALGIKNARRWGDLVNDRGGMIELWQAGQRLPLARWPNGEPTTMLRVIDTGEATPERPKRGGTFEFRDERARNWPVERGVWLQGYWRVPWQIETVRIGRLDPANKTITLAAPVAGGIGSKYRRPQGSGEEPYWVVNLLEELDQPGEWCVDFETQRLFVWPPPLAATEPLVIADLAEPVMSLNDVSHLSLEGLTFTGGLGHGLEITGGSNVTVRSCQVRNVGRHAVVVAGGVNHTVRDCELAGLGGSGILLAGGQRRSLTPAGHQALNNHIHHYGAIQRVYSAGINLGYALNSVGMVVAHNEIHDAPHAGILYGGNDQLIEYNRIYRVVQDSDDMGGIYTHGDWTSAGNVIRYNLIYDSPLAHGIYCDDGDSGDEIFGNLCYGLNTGVFLGGGHQNLVHDNLVVNCRCGVHIDARGVSRGYNASNRRMAGLVNQMQPAESPWRERFPWLTTLLQQTPELPTGVRIENNVFIGCRKGIEQAAKPTELRAVTIADNLELAHDPGFANPGDLNFDLPTDNPIRRALPKFVVPPWRETGRVGPAQQPPSHQ